MGLLKVVENEAKADSDQALTTTTWNLTADSCTPLLVLVLVFYYYLY